MSASESQPPGKILPVYVHPLNEDSVRALKAAKAQMTVDYQIVPRPAQAGAGRVLALSAVPWVALDGIAQVRDPNNLGAMAAAIHWAATGEPDSRVTTAEQQLSKIFGKEVREITREQLAYEGASKHLDLGNEKKVRFNK